MQRFTFIRIILWLQASQHQESRYVGTPLGHVGVFAAWKRKCERLPIREIVTAVFFCRYFGLTISHLWAAI
jgi:hypothetical protein